MWIPFPETCTKTIFTDSYAFWLYCYLCMCTGCLEINMLYLLFILFRTNLIYNLQMLAFINPKYVQDLQNEEAQRKPHQASLLAHLRVPF
jgi:hypothetical protein